AGCAGGAAVRAGEFGARVVIILLWTSYARPNNYDPGPELANLRCLADAVRDAVLQAHHLPEEVDARDLGDLVLVGHHVAQLEVGAEADLVGEAREAILERGDEAVVGAHVVDEENLALGL